MPLMLRLRLWLLYLHTRSLAVLPKFVHQRRKELPQRSREVCCRRRRTLPLAHPSPSLPPDSAATIAANYPLRLY